jgi:hypothetical protein
MIWRWVIPAIVVGVYVGCCTIFAIVSRRGDRNGQHRNPGNPGMQIKD